MHFEGVFVAWTEVMDAVRMGVVEFGEFFGENFDRNVLELERKAGGFSIELIVAVYLWREGT